MEKLQSGRRLRPGEVGVGKELRARQRQILGVGLAAHRPCVAPEGGSEKGDALRHTLRVARPALVGVERYARDHGEAVDT